MDAAVEIEVEVTPSKTADLSLVVREHAQFVRSTLQRLGLRSPDLDDAFQDVFVVVHRRLHTLDESKPLRGWLFGVCSNVARKARASKHRRRERELEVEPTDPQGHSPEGRLAQAQARARLSDLLDQLEDGRRVVFVMFEIEQSDCQAIAQTLEIPLGTVYSRLHAARRDLERAAHQIRLRDARESGGADER